MTGWRRAAGVLGGPVVACVLLVPPAQAAVPVLPGHRLCTLRDAEVVESSGLVDRGDRLLTVNDSGDDAVVYGIDAATGRTVSRTTYAEDVEDVEAVAPGSDGTVWVGDIGDNRRRRDDVDAYRVRPRDGDQPGPRFTLAYPDGPHDAETLLVQPRTQRLFVVTKSVFGGTVYAAPRTLVPGSVNRLRAFARVRGLVTDGAFFPDGRRVVLRGYGTASVYAFPSFALLGTVRLPRQPQGEAVSVGPRGRVLLSSEGVHADVLQVRLPAALTGPRAAASAGPAPRPPRVRARPAASETRRGPGDWLAIGAVGTALVGAAYLITRGPRTR